MPKKDGNIAIEEIMSFDPDATIIICSSVGTQSLLKCALEAGAKDFVQKPIDQQQVIDIVNKFLEGR
jgi:two-component system chemotaxis response regulator CheY